MEVRLLGTGGLHGWPLDGCRCASCQRGRSAGRRRAAGQVVVDEALRIDCGEPPVPDGVPPGTQAAQRRGTHSPGGGYRVLAVPGAWDVTAPDGGRLLVAERPGGVPDPPADTPPYDVALLDLLECPSQLGALRARGLVHAGTTVAALCADHRAPSETELARRCSLWGVTLPDDGAVLTSGTLTGGVVTLAGQTAASGKRAAAGEPHRVLILGGARSGKSSEAVLRLAGEPQVTYLAAGPFPGTGTGGTGSAGGTGGTGTAGGTGSAGGTATGLDDPEWASRVAAHKAGRPPWWQTLESTDVAGVLRRASGAVLIDGIGTWLAAVMTAAGAWGDDAGDRDTGARDTWIRYRAAAGQDAAREAVAAAVSDLVLAWRQTAARVVAVSDQVGSGVVPATRSGRLFRDQLGWLNQRLAAESELTVLVVAGKIATIR